MTATTHAEPTSTAAAGEEVYLDPSHLRLLRQVWQGRATYQRNTSTRANSAPWVFCVDDQKVSTVNSIMLITLLRDGYVTHPTALVGDEWVNLQPTEKGETVLSALGADATRYSKFHDLTATEARALANDPESRQP